MKVKKLFFASKQGLLKNSEAKLGEEESNHNLSPELKIDEVKGFNIYILKILNPLRGWYRAVFIFPSSASSTGGY